MSFRTGDSSSAGRLMTGRPVWPHGVAAARKVSHVKTGNAGFGNAVM
jgi:hypothetical protein